MTQEKMTITMKNKAGEPLTCLEGVTLKDLQRMQEEMYLQTAETFVQMIHNDSE